MPSDLIKWLYPGIKIKRWFFTSLLGVVIIAGGAIALSSSFPLVRIFGFVIIGCGMILFVMGLGKMIVSFLTLFLPQGEKDLVTILYQKRYLERGPKIVAVGGGHGLSHLLLGLKEYSANITAIVTVADSGGSSGRLREEFNIAAPGDIRNCLVALADAPKLMGNLFQFRFSKESQLQGHNFGNLFLTAMIQITGDFEKAVEESSRVLSIRGKVVPSTVSNVHLVAEYIDGTITEGEAKIPGAGVKIKRVFLKPADCAPTANALEAIKAADVIVLGPGSLYTSVIPNLIIPGMSEAIAAASAYKIYVCNVMTQPGETDGYSASDHVRALLDHSRRGLLNACLANDASVPADALVKYKGEGSYPVAADVDAIREMGCTAVATDLLGITDFVRHDSEKLTKALIQLIERH
ncbi:MAG: gluconeogenesis factor YvcK family protein, partial [Candidatus Omnitrophota bacterium]|nr:gluconeogenesis factor YvcK family protein [Candidatus Omnitrophota bacterium]